MQKDLFNTKQDAFTDRLGIRRTGAPLIVCYGGGVDSTAMLVAMKREGILPDIVLFADTGGEKPETYECVNRMDGWLASWGAPAVTWVRYTPRVGYSSLEGECLHNQVLPGAAFGRHSCSLKWKITPQDQFLEGVSRGPNKRHGWQPALEAWASGLKPIKLIGYDNSAADIRRRNKVQDADNRYESFFPLQTLGWERPECVQAIQDEGPAVPIKSACYYCPASKKWELWWLAAHHPDLFENALNLERTALEGRNSRWAEARFGDVFASDLAEGSQFPCKSAAGLGRRFSWNQWAREEGIVNHEGKVAMSSMDCLRESELLQTEGNALDVRALECHRHVEKMGAVDLTKV